jgi:hypothetical protein
MMLYVSIFGILDFFPSPSIPNPTQHFGTWAVSVFRKQDGEALSLVT